MRIYCNRQNRERTARETERLLRARFLTPWAAKDIREIKKHDVLKIIHGIVEEGKPSAANHAFAAVRKLFSWCVQRGIVEVNPCTGIGAPSATVVSSGPVKRSPASSTTTTSVVARSAAT